MVSETPASHAHPEQWQQEAGRKRGRRCRRWSFTDGQLSSRTALQEEASHLKIKTGREGKIEGEKERETGEKERETGEGKRERGDRV